MIRITKTNTSAIYLALLAVYFVTGKLALKLAFFNASATPVWPCSGIALVILLTLGYRLWPVIFVGSFLVNLTTAGSILTSAGIATGNTLEAVLGCYFVLRYAGGRHAFERSQHIFKFTLWAAMLSTAVAASVGCSTLWIGGFVSSRDYSSTWFTWWLGDGVGILLLVPLLLLWAENPRFNWSRNQIFELIAIFAGLIASAGFVFGPDFHSLVRDYPFEYLCFPFLIWAAFRYGRRKAATALCVLAVVATWGTVHGYGPFVRSSPNTSLLLLQSFLGIAAVTSMVLAAESTEHKRAEEHIRRLAVSDPHTGLANYRRLVEAIDSEIRRYSRSGAPFSVILLDLDGLKKINDTHGHLVGSRALCRLAHILRLQSREIDVPARYGGDEFVLLLPETDAAAAVVVAQRITSSLRAENETPKLSVSTGVASYPADGHTLDELLVSADQLLYRDKAAKPLIRA